MAVDVPLWRTPSYSSGHGGNCVEVALSADGSARVRHSKNPDGAVLDYTPAEWAAFLAGVKDGEFDPA